MKERSSRVVGDNPVANYRDDFAQSLEQSERSLNTIKNYLCDLDAFARWFETERKEELTPTKITPTDLREYKQFLTQKLALKPQSINRKLSTLRSFLSWAVHAELLPDHRIPRFPKAVQEKDRGTQWLEISDIDIAHLSPARYEHINPYGKYQFDVALNLSRQQLRPLRPPRRGTL